MTPPPEPPPLTKLRSSIFDSLRNIHDQTQYIKDLIVDVLRQIKTHETNLVTLVAQDINNNILPRGKVLRRQQTKINTFLSKILIPGTLKIPLSKVHLVLNKFPNLNKYDTLRNRRAVPGDWDELVKLKKYLKKLEKIAKFISLPLP